MPSLGRAGVRQLLVRTPCSSSTADATLNRAASFTHLIAKNMISCQDIRKEHDCLPGITHPRDLDSRTADHAKERETSTVNSFHQLCSLLSSKAVKPTYIKLIMLCSKSLTTSPSLSLAQTGFRGKYPRYFSAWVMETIPLVQGLCKVPSALDKLVELRRSVDTGNIRNH